MKFEDRVDQANIVINEFLDTFWGHPEISKHVIVVDLALKYNLDREVRQLIRYEYSPTIRFVKFSPDFLIVDRRDLSRVYLLHYKATQTPLYSQRRIGQIRQKSANQYLDWPDIGQWELEAYEHYKALASIKLKVAILNYCAYHPRPLVCDFVNIVQPLHQDTVQAGTQRGSGTPFMNFDLNNMRTCEEFFLAGHQFDPSLVLTLTTQIEQKLSKQLPVRHHQKSPLFKDG